MQPRRSAALWPELRLFLIALQFLTRIPIPRSIGYEPAWLNACVRYFPAIGALVGAAAAAVLWLAAQLWPAVIAALLAVAATAWLTGCFHEDGLADTFDALLGTASRERALEIMKDARIGSYGATALVLVLAARVGALAALATHGLLAAGFALVASHMMARTAAVAVMAALPYAGDEEHARARPLARGVGAQDAVLAASSTLLLLPVALALGTPSPGRLLAAWLAAAAVALTMIRWLRRRLGGYTGDALGATEQLAEAAVLLALLAAWQ